jgi:hypothetical protein
MPVFMTSEPSPNLWLWPSILSLDAPLIAVSWQLLLARALHLSVNPLEPLVLGLSVWFVYLADHLLDALRPPAAAWEPARKAFYRHHFHGASVAAAALAVAILLLAYRALRPGTFYAGVALSAAVLLYFALVHLAPGRRRTRWPRELVVALLFTLGTILAIWTRSQRSGLLAFPALLLALLVWVNCCAIETWEWQRSGRLPASAPHASTQWASRHLRSLSLVIMALALLASLFQSPPAFSAATLLSGFAFYLLALWQPRLHMNLLPVAADLALYTPLLFLPFLGLR